MQVFVLCFYFFAAIEACTVWCQSKNGSPKSRGWTFPDGTVCQMQTSRYRKAAYCINGRCEVNLNNIASEEKSKTQT